MSSISGSESDTSSILGFDILAGRGCSWRRLSEVYEEGEVRARVMCLNLGRSWSSVTDALPCRTSIRLSDTVGVLGGGERWDKLALCGRLGRSIVCPS